MRFTLTALPAVMALPLALLPFMLSSCATQLDPAEVCSAEWVKPRAVRAVADIERSTGSAMKSLRRVGETYASGRTPGPLQLLSLVGAMKSLERQVKSGRGMRDLKAVARTCNDPKILTETLTGFMRDQGLPDNMISFVQQLPVYQTILEDVVAPAAIPRS